MESATTSTAAVCTIYTLTWASSELVRITTSLTDTIRRMVPATCNTVDLLFNIIEVHFLMEELRLKAFKLARLACELAKAATVITNADRDYSEAVSNSEEVFHPFSRLPTELRLLIWTMAAQPPSFAIAYFMSFEATLAGREPAARFMDNRALWTTCWESRHTIKRVYEKNRNLHKA
ncbi:hypothetical protein CMQ_5301 [Grosmannia clavigera kw1407]|uniref:2EXR domain-containing protein n=1 Tax=Grosmannia clavigera (strain kw1407 / UAMH 11150) TaxID=655863 RepID=F0XBT1_GROCL|nr:uncharacterized protein CMQ_5301 [Grosmannia clavigera kw1407]EFX05039.1 hypothetical protein CMQ_5301 [Grosmannia clavigera kw1407]